MPRVIFLFWATFSLSGSFVPRAHALPPVSEWSEVFKLADHRRYAEALEELQKHPREDAHYFFNLGTLYHQLGQEGPAVAYLEKAYRLQPKDSDIQSQWLLARDALGRAIGIELIDPASSGLERTFEDLPSDFRQFTPPLFALIGLILALRLYANGRKFDRPYSRIWDQPTAKMSLMCLTLSLIGWGLSLAAAANPPAICLESQILRSGPGPHFLEIAKAPAGMKVRLLRVSVTETSDPAVPASPVWQQVRYSAEGIGWIPSSSLLLL
jgi:tetratricopeptide (TPR) repeat protein